MPVVPHLSPEWRLFLRFIRQLHYGRIEGLSVRRGTPIQSPAPTFFQEIKFCSETRAEADSDADLDDYCRKPAVSEFIQSLRNLGDGVIESLEVQRGLPFKIMIAGHGFSVRGLK